MASGILITNIAYILYIIVYIKRVDIFKQTNVTHGQLINVVVYSVAFDVIRYLTWQSTIWIFAFKYWVTSIEIPKVIKKQKVMLESGLTIPDQ